VRLGELLAEAQRRAEGFGHATTGTEHILLALVDRNEPPPAVVRLRLHRGELRAVVQLLNARGAQPGRPPLTPEARLCLARFPEDAEAPLGPLLRQLLAAGTEAAVAARASAGRPEPPRVRLSRGARMVGTALRWTLLGLRGLLAYFSNVTATVAFLPGVLLRGGARVLVGRFQDVTVRHDLFIATAGQRYAILGDHVPPRAWLLVHTLPPLVLLAVGALNLLQPLLALELLGVVPLPALMASPELVIAQGGGGEDTGVAVLLELASADPSSFRLWLGLSCWVCAMPQHHEVATARTALRNGGTTSRLLAAGLAPVQALSRLYRAIEDVTLWLGLNALLTTGVLTALMLWATALLLLRLAL
jgi:hypothetical protein